MKRTTLLVGITLLALLAAACSAVDFDALAALIAGEAGSGPAGGPLGGAVAELPSPDPALVTPTPPSSAISLPTLAPTASGPLATLTAIAGLVATPDFSATPYVIALTGRPHFVEFHARW